MRHILINDMTMAMMMRMGFMRMMRCASFADMTVSE